jgi:hypothetical protein
MRIRTLLVMSILTGFISAGCGDRKETKPAPAKTTSSASPAPATIRLTFPHVISISAETPHNTGSFDQKSGAMVSHKNEAGAVVFGPYLELEPGQYQVTFSLNAGGGQDEIIGKVDVSAFSDTRPNNPVVEKELRRAKKDQNVMLDFSSVPGKKYEFRVWANGNGSLSVKKITLDRKTQG